MNIGKKIKELRIKNNITQERLAEEMNVSPQAVCKWESGKTMPDIALLPELSVFFGVTIDELFELTDSAHFERINNMLHKRLSLDDDEFSYAESFLKERNAKALLARLYENSANEYHAKSIELAKQALKENPQDENIHSVLCEPLWGCWDLANHHELIGFYYDFISKNSDNINAYEYLAELLTADCRLDEADKVVKRIDKMSHSLRTYRIMAKIEIKKSNIEAAKSLLDKMTDEYPDNPTAWSYKADAFASLGLYDDAIGFYAKAADLSKPPRYIDNNLSMAHIYEIQKDFRAAACEYKKIIDILITDYDAPVDGDVIHSYEQKIAECEKRVSTVG